MTSILRTLFACAMPLALALPAAHAQAPLTYSPVPGTSVTLYGIVDLALAHQSSQTTLGSDSGGKPATKILNGVWAGSRLGLKGSQDVGGGTSALFVLEAGYSPSSGGQQYTNALFGRQSWVGLTNPAYGTLSAGRQYTAYYLLIAPYSPTTWLTGAFGAHPGDLDQMDTLYRANNTIMYMSPTLNGLKFGGSYSISGLAGSLGRGSTWSGAAQFTSGAFGATAAITKLNNSTPGGGAFGADSTSTAGGEQGVSALTNGYQTASAQQRAAVASGYRFTSTLDATATLSNVRYIPSSGSTYRQTAVFNTAGLTLHWKAFPSWNLSGGLSETRAKAANGISDAARYHQLTLAQYYELSERAGLYLLQAYQRASGQTLGTPGASSIIDATATIGDAFQGAPSSGRSQAAVGAGMIYRF